MKQHDNAARVADEKSVASGGFWLLLNSVAGLVASFATTPFLVRHLGTTSFGVFALIQSIVAYIGVGDLGMGVASTRFAATALEDRDRRTEAAIVWNAVVITLVPSALLSLVVITWSRTIVIALRVPEVLAAEARVGLMVATVAVCARNLAGVFNTPSVVRLRYRAITILTITVSLIQAVGLIVVVRIGASFVVCLSLVALSALLGLVLMFVLGIVLLPELRIPAVRPSLIQPMLKYSSSVLVALLLGLAVTQLDRLFISRGLSPAAVGYYSVAASLASVLAFIPRAVKSALFPAVSRLDASNADAVSAVYSRTLRIITVGSLPMCGVLVVFGHAILTFWVGKDFAAQSVRAFVPLAYAATFGGLATLSSATLYATGRPSSVARLQVAAVIPYVLVLPFAIDHYGFVGAGLCSLARALVEFILGILMTRRQLAHAIRYVEFMGLAAACAALTATYFIPLPCLRYVSALVAVAAYSVIVWNITLRAEERTLLRDLFFARLRFR